MTTTGPPQSLSLTTTAIAAVRSLWLLLFIALWAVSPAPAAAIVVGGAVMPHGGVVLNPANLRNASGPAAAEAAAALHSAARDAADFLLSLQPDVVLLVTPHGLSHPRDFLLYYTGSAAGTVDLGTTLTTQDECGYMQCTEPPCSYSVTVDLSVSVTAALAADLVSHAVSPLSGFGPPGQGDQPLPLGWAEVVPLWFLHQAYQRANTQGPSSSWGAQQSGEEQQRGGNSGQAGHGAAGEAVGGQRRDGGARRQRRRWRATAAGMAAGMDVGGGLNGFGSGDERRGEEAWGTGEEGREAQAARREALAASETAGALHALRITGAAGGGGGGAGGGGSSPKAGSSVGGSAAGAAGGAVADAAGSRPALSMPPVVVLSLPSRRYDHSVSMVDELLALGRAVHGALDELDERVVVVVSGDLAHTWVLRTIGRVGAGNNRHVLSCHAQPP